MKRELEEILEDFENNRIAFKNYRQKGDFTKTSLLEFEGRFVDLKAELTPYKKELIKEWTRRDDKAASAIKFRMAIAIHEGEFKDEKGNLIYDSCSINQAEKFATGCDRYKEFIDQRAFYKESLTNITDVRNDCESFTYLIKDILNTM